MIGKFCQKYQFWVGLGRAFGRFWEGLGGFGRYKNKLEKQEG